MPGLLTELADRARVLSITASSAIEGVIVADADRAQRIINRQATTLRNRSEQELAGYRDAQDYLFQQDWRPLNAGLILHLHRLLFAHTAMPGGSSRLRTTGRGPSPMAPPPCASSQCRLHPFAVDDLQALHEAVAAASIIRCSCPGCSSSTFSSSTPSRTATGAWPACSPAPCFSEHGYTVGRYVSLEQAIAESADAYYQSAPGFHSRLARRHRRPMALARLFHWRDRRRLRRLRGSRSRGPVRREQATARPRTHPAPCAGHVPSRRHQGGNARRQRPDHPARPGAA